MIAHLIEILASLIIATISSSGYTGIILLMAIESACIPLPSEIIMPFSGYLVFRGDFGLLSVGLAGGFGCVVGSIPAYYLGAYGGRPLIERYGKYVLISHRDLDTAERWFDRWGDWAIFFSRLMPVVRTFISFPAGVARMNFPRFPRLFPLVSGAGLYRHEVRSKLGYPGGLFPSLRYRHRGFDSLGGCLLHLAPPEGN